MVTCTATGCVKVVLGKLIRADVLLMDVPQQEATATSHPRIELPYLEAIATLLVPPGRTVAFCTPLTERLVNAMATDTPGVPAQRTRRRQAWVKR